jgi:hypothetical protein
VVNVFQSANVPASNIIGGLKHGSVEDFLALQGDANTSINVSSPLIGIDQTGSNVIVNYQGAQHLRETATGTFTASVIIETTLIDSSGGAVTVTLPNGRYAGQRKVIRMTDATTSSTVSVTNHITSAPEVFTFADANDRLILVWDGVTWNTLVNNGAAT